MGFEVATSIWEGLVNFYNSSWFLLVKIPVGVYTFVLFVDIILILLGRNFKQDLRLILAGADVPLDVTEKSHGIGKRWQLIEKKLASDNPSDYKVAIIEADKEVDKLLERIGYPGKNMTEKLENITPLQIDNVEELRQAHQFRNKIIYEKDLAVAKEQAGEVIDAYKKYLESVEAF